MPLGDFVTLKRGYDLPSSLRVDGPVPVVSSSGVTGCHDAARVKAPGVVTGRYGTLGQVFFINEDFWPLNTALYVKDFQGNDPRFSAYFLKSVLTNTASDKAAVPGVNRNDLHARTIRVTRDIGKQRAIALILSAYDDLIENNQRRIRLLEQQARLIYEEWFVRLCFPGCERAGIVDGVPSGWNRTRLASICKDVRKTVDPRTLSPDTAYIGLEHIPRRSITLIDWGSPASVESTKFTFVKGDILFGKIRPYLHKVGLAIVDGITSSDAIVVRPTGSDLDEYLLLLLSSDPFVSLASKTVREGSKMPRADWKFLLRSEILVPSVQHRRVFGDAIRPILDQLRSLAMGIRCLAEARDLLLPRLMGGEDSV